MDEQPSPDPAGPVATLPSPAPSASPPSASDRRIPRSVLVIAGAVAGLIVVALIIALANPVQPASYAPGTPEAAFQDFYAAWEDRDLDTAYGLLSSDVRAGLSLSDYRRQDSEMSWARDQDRRVVLLASRVTGDRAVLDLRVDQFSEGPLGGDRYSYERAVNLVREAGAWYVDEGLLGLETVYYPAKS